MRRQYFVDMFKVGNIIYENWNNREYLVTGGPEADLNMVDIKNGVMGKYNPEFRSWTLLAESEISELEKLIYKID